MFSFFAECASEASTREISPVLPPGVLARSYPTEVPDYILLRLRSRRTQEKKIKGLCTDFSSAACYNHIYCGIREQILHTFRGLMYFIARSG